ncbi:MAG: 4Fe-4S dicluster domain-containing protein [Armatimonadota bacterium]|jgi:sulfhydrogenase subunit beta (sulfur reductase)
MMQVTPQEGAPRATEVVMTHEATTGFIGRLVEGGPVMGPRERKSQPGFVRFDWLDSPEELTLQYTTTTIPPKKAFFPPRQPLFEFELTEPPRITAVEEATPFTLVGVHPCDLAALNMLDDAYAQEPAEACWPAARARATVIGVDCLPDEYCFCFGAGTCYGREGADLFLTPIDRGYLVEVLTLAGHEMLRLSDVEAARDEDREQAEQFRQTKARSVSASIKASPGEFADLLEQNDFGDIWREISERCYSCGSCNTTCPTCFCFDINDEFDLGLTGGRRVRTWDSCQLQEFALVAGGHNFRRIRWQRVRHRWHRKFLYLYRDFGRAYCTGCGRCSRACTADINIVDVSNQLIDRARGRA